MPTQLVRTTYQLPTYPTFVPSGCVGAITFVRITAAILALAWVNALASPAPCSIAVRQDDTKMEAGPAPIYMRSLHRILEIKREIDQVAMELEAANRHLQQTMGFCQCPTHKGLMVLRPIYEADRRRLQQKFEEAEGELAREMSRYLIEFMFVMKMASYDEAQGKADLLATIPTVEIGQPIIPAKTMRRLIIRREAQPVSTGGSEHWAAVSGR